MVALHFLAISLAGHFIAHAQVPTAWITVEPSEISLGDTAVLTWRTSGATETFVSGVGRLPPNGRSAVTPQATSHYVLIAEGPAGVATAEQILVVAGSKGGDEFPEQSRFRHPLSFAMRASSFPALVERFHAILQDSLRHTVMLTHGAGQVLRFVTNSREGSDLVGPDEERIGRRRLAYEVELPQPGKDGEVRFTIRSLIEYQRRIERVWRPEPKDSLYDVQSRKLEQLLGVGR